MGFVKNRNSSFTFFSYFLIWILLLVLNILLNGSFPFLLSLYLFLLLSLLALIHFGLSRLILLLSKRLSLLFDLIVTSVLFVFFLLDPIVYSNQGIHLYDRVVIDTLKNPNWNHELQLGIAPFVMLAISLLAFQLFSFLYRYFMAKALNRLFDQWLLFKTWMALLSICSLVIFFARGKVDTSAYPFFHFVQGKIAQRPLTVNYHPEISSLPASDDVVMVLAESLRADYFNSESMPKTFAKAQDLGCLVAEKHYSGGHTTEYGIFTYLYGVNGYHYDLFRDHQVPSAAIESLKNNGYHLKAYSASQLKAWNGAGFIFLPFDQYREYVSDNIPNDDRQMMEAFFADDAEIKQKKFSFLFFNSTHHNYFFPADYALHTPYAPDSYNHLEYAVPDDHQKMMIVNRYRNSVGYLDSLLSDFLMRLQNAKRPIILALSGDHGEEFWEFGLLGHGKANFVNPRVRVPLLWCELNRQSNFLSFLPTITFHQDLMPTIIHALGGASLNSFNGRSLIDTHDERYGIITGTKFPFGRDRMAFINQHYKFSVRKSGRELWQLQSYKVTDHQDRAVFDKTSVSQLKKIDDHFVLESMRFLRPFSP